MFPASLSPPLFSPLSFLFLVQLSLAVRPSFIRIFQLTFKRRVFPLRESGPQLSDGRQPARPERPFIDGTIRSIFAPLYNNYILSATATAQREKPNGSHSPRATTTTTSSKWSHQSATHPCGKREEETMELEAA